MNGALRTNFSGVDGPMCGTLDACGLSGTIDYTTSATGGELFLAGVRRLRHGERRPTLSSALRELKAGRLLTGGYGAMRPDSTAKVFATVSRPGDTTCTDTATPAIPPLDLFGAGRTMHFLMDLPDELIVDGLRTRCPGPMETETLAQGPLAAGHVAAARLGARTISVSLSRPGTFTSDPYSGTRSGAIELRLVRNGVKEKVIHVRKSEAP
jgi:hypothetical protein